MKLGEISISDDFSAGIRSIPERDLLEFFDSYVGKVALEVKSTPNEDLTGIKGKFKILDELKNQFVTIRRNQTPKKQ